MINNNSTFRATSDSEEIFNNESDGSYYVCNCSMLYNNVMHCIPWHWHSYLEMDYILEGEIELRSTEQTYHLKKGDLFFVNHKVAHYLSTEKKDTAVYAHLFDTRFLGGPYNSLLETKYLLPIIRNKALDIYAFSPDTPRKIKMADLFLQIVKLESEEPYGYEFEARSELSRLWLLFLEETKNKFKDQPETDILNIDRLKSMIKFIETHYMDKITLDDIAFAASISGRECNRCFQKCVQNSPMNFLNEYRVQMAAQKLLQTDDMIIDISENCGFSSSSYFGKTFMRYMNCTPKEYRTRQRTAQK